jgi:hypothetical protein
LSQGIAPPGNSQCLDVDFVDVCPASSQNSFPDPLFGAMDWIYEMINVKPVWAAGISKFDV